jgi:hypothetical protein
MHRYVCVVVSAAMASCAGMSKSSDSSASGSSTSSTSASGTSASTGSMSGGMSGMGIQVKLDSTHEVPVPNVESSSPTGTASFTPSGNSISYKLTATGLTSPVTVAHIHMGPPGKAGPVIVPLTISQGSDPNSATGEGSFDESAIKATPDGTKMSWNDLVSGLSNGSLYVNIHTQNNKPGEIRGQIGGQ